MKKYIFSLFMFLSTTISFAQSVNKPVENRKFAPISKVTADEHGIIREQPDGEYRIYVREGRATYANLYFIDEPQSGIVEEVVFSHDGTKAYFKNILSHATTYTWVEGNIEGNTITVPLGQMVYWFENDNYGMRLARVKVKGSINEYTVETKGNITFTIDGDKLILNNTSGNKDETTYDALGLVYTGAYEGEWSYYLDYETVLTYAHELPVTPPENLVTQTYSMENQTYGHLLQVGFDGNDVYMQNVTENKLPQSWMKGTIKDGKIVFPAQCAGIGGAFMYYFCGINGERVPQEGGGYTWNYEWPAGDLICDYDPETRSFSTDQTLFLMTSLNANDGRGEIFHMPRFRPYEEYAGTPQDPKVTAYVVYANGALNIAMFEVPLQDTEGRFMDPEKLSYRLFVDDDEPYILYKDEYKNIEEDMEEIPYLFSDKKGTIVEKAYGIYIYQTGFDRFGIQTIYRGGGEANFSNISYWYFNEDDAVEGIVSGEKTVPVARYDVTGRRIGDNHRGLVLTRMSDGKVVKTIDKK